MTALFPHHCSGDAGGPDCALGCRAPGVDGPLSVLEDLRRRWTRIEEAAKRNEPEERKKRRAENCGSEKERASRALATDVDAGAIL